MAKHPGEADRSQVREEAEWAATWLLDFCKPGYGPEGGVKLVVHDVPQLMASPASALREADIDHPAMEPYKRLAQQMQRLGDQATTALLFAAGLVHEGERAMRRGLPRAVVLDGYRMARRQALAWLGAQARAAKPAEIARSVTARPWIAPVLDGIHGLQEAGQVALDDIHIHAKTGVESRWLDGLVLELPDAAARPNARIALIDKGPRKSTHDVELLLERPVDEDHAWAAAVDRHQLDLVVCAEAIPDQRRRAHVLYLDQAPASLLARIESATGARRAATLEMLEESEIGVADLSPVPRQKVMLLRGPGPSATFQIDAGTFHESVVDEAERFLRAAGTILEDPRGVPGGWRATLQASLRQASDLADGKLPLAIQAAARAVPQFDGRMDSYPCVRAALDGAFATAEQILRLDGRHSKRASTPGALRGGTGPAGSPLGMPGDIPPLM